MARTVFGQAVQHGDAFMPHHIPPATAAAFADFLLPEDHPRHRPLSDLKVPFIPPPDTTAEAAARFFAAPFAARPHAIPVVGAPPAAQVPVMPLNCVHVASRMQLCINDKIRRSSGGNSSQLNDNCKAAVLSQRGPPPKPDGPVPDIEDMVTAKGPKCEFADYDKLRQLRERMRVTCPDIAELRRMAVEVGACPYLATRQMTRCADVVFVHFNYLVEDNMRRGLLLHEPVSDTARPPNEYRIGRLPEPKTLEDVVGNMCATPLSMHGDVVVFDEGHNVADVTRQAHKSSITYTEVRRAKHLLGTYYEVYGGDMGLEVGAAVRSLLELARNLQEYLREAQGSWVSFLRRSQRLGDPRLPCALDPPPESKYTSGEARYHAEGDRTVIRDSGFSNFTFEGRCHSVNPSSITAGAEDLRCGQLSRRAAGRHLGSVPKALSIVAALPPAVARRVRVQRASLVWSTTSGPFSGRASSSVHQASSEHCISYTIL